MARVDEIKARLEAAEWKNHPDGTSSINPDALANFRGLAADDIRYLLSKYEEVSNAVLQWYLSEHNHDITIHVPGYECPACQVEANLMGVARRIQVGKE
jgi:hypothetical protein